MAVLRVFIFIVTTFIGTYTVAFLVNGRPSGVMPMAPAIPDGVKPPPPQFYEFQLVNHFDGSDQRMWKQVSLHYSKLLPCDGSTF